MQSRDRAARPPATPGARPVVAGAALAWLAASTLPIVAAPLAGSPITVAAIVAATLVVPGFLVACALDLQPSWRSPWAAVATSGVLGAGIALPVAGSLRAVGQPLEYGGPVIAAIGAAALAAIALRERRAALHGFDGLVGRATIEWIADGAVALAAIALAATFVRAIEPAMPGGDLWYYLSYIDWMAEHPGEAYQPHTADPEEWNPRLQSSPLLAYEAMVARLVRIDASVLEVFWSGLPPVLIALALAAGAGLASALGCGPRTRIAWLIAQLALLYATAPYVFDRTTSGSRWPAAIWWLRTSQDKVFLALVLAPAVAMLTAEWLERGERRWLVALALAGLACVLTHPLGLPFFAMATLPFAVTSVASGATSTRRAAALAALLLPLLAWPLAQRSSEGVPNTLADDAAFARRAHLVRDSLRISSRAENRYTAHPSLLAHPLLGAGVAAGGLLGFVARRRADARYAFAATAAPIALLYTPGLAPLAGAVVTPYLLWRFTWLLPVALSLAVATSAVARAARRAWPAHAFAAPLATGGVAAALALTTGLPEDLARLPEARAALMPAVPRASQAAAWIEPLHARVGDDVVLLDPSVQPLALSLAAGARTGYWRWGSDPERFARVRSLFGARLLTGEHLALLRELEARWVGVADGVAIGEALALRPDRFEPAGRFGGIALYRVVSAAPSHDPSLDEPIAFWRARHAAEPDSPVALARLALALAEGGQSGEARALLQAADARGALDAHGLEILGTLQLAGGQPARARDTLARSLERDPARERARNNLAWLLATSPDERIRDAERAYAHALVLLETARADPGALDTIAAAFAAAGHFEQARHHAARAVVLYESAGAAPEHVAPIRRRRDAYRAGRPFIEDAD